MTHRIIQIYRGTEAQNNAYTGSAGELTMDTTNNELRLHDGSTAGGHEIGKGYHPSLFDFKWADHLINDPQWLRGDTFSWQDGGVYEAAYNHLVDDIDGKSLTSETIGTTTIQFYLADDGHKICPASEASNVASIFTATGVAWYYIIDTVNERFKLPRTKFGFNGLRDTVGKYVAESLPNIKGVGTIQQTLGTPTGPFYKATAASGGTTYDAASNRTLLGFDASLCSSTYQDSAPVQQKATQMYLYFYVGSFTQSALENTAGLNAELFNGKAGIDLDNLSAAGRSTGASLAMPSDDYIDLTLGASGSTYTAPANGYVVWSHSTGHFLASLDSNNVRLVCSWSNNSAIYIPVRKGQKFTTNYNTSGTTDIFRFVYAQGEAN